MSVKVQVLARPKTIAAWLPHLRAALQEAGIDAEIGTGFAPETVDYVVYAPHGAEVDFTRYSRAKAVLGLWAGVETVVGNPTLTQPYARMVDGGLTQGMVEWVAGHVLRHHLGMDCDICRSDATWAPDVPPLAGNRSVGVLGLGALGSAVAGALAGLGFDVTGWSRHAKSLVGVECAAGDDGLARVLARSQILVLLLPLTPATDSLLNAQTLAHLPEGAVVLNPGRGGLIDDDALLAALDNGHIGHATLDTFRVEPLPADHPFWAHPKVTVTPHIASETRPETASRVIADNIRRGEAGAPLLHLVDRAAGY